LTFLQNQCLTPLSLPFLNPHNDSSSITLRSNLARPRRRQHRKTARSSSNTNTITTRRSKFNHAMHMRS
jgi:hypothetical protein